MATAARLSCAPPDLSCPPSPDLDVPIDLTQPVKPAPTRATAEITTDLFARKADNQLYHRWWAAGRGWTEWENLRGELASGAGVASHDAGILHLGVLGTDNRVWQRAYVNDGHLAAGWSNWAHLGTREFRSAPAAASWGTDHFAMFARGTDDRIYQNQFRFGGAGWTDWQPFPGDTNTFTGAPAAVTYDVRRLHIFAKGPDDRIYDKHLLAAGGWSGWNPLGSRTFHSGPAAVSWGPRHLEVFAVDRQHRNLWHNWYIFDHGWHGWAAFDGTQTFTEAPAAVTHKLETLNVYALGTDGRIWERFHKGQGVWSPWAPTGDQQFTSAPAAASWSNR
jgi:hypothetical protein